MLVRRVHGNVSAGVGNLKAGAKFTRTSFRSTQISFPATNVISISKLSGVASASGGLTLSMTTISGTVPAQTQTPQQRGVPGAQGGGANGPRGIDFASVAVAGVDESKPALGAITPSQISKGKYFTSGDAREAILNVSYARTHNMTVGSTLKLGDKTYAVVGVVSTPLGGQASDVYIKLGQLQKLSDRVGRVNTVYVRATSASQVDAVAAKIRTTLSGSSVSTAKTPAILSMCASTRRRSIQKRSGFQKPRSSRA